MDSAFYNRTGFTSGWGFGAYSFYPSAKSRFSFVKRVVPFVFWQGGQDRVQNGSDVLAVPGIRVHMARQGFFRADYVGGHEPWVGQPLPAGPLARLRQRPVLPLAARRRQRQRRLRHVLRRSDPFQGRSRNLSAFATFQPNSRLSEQIEWQYVDFNRADTGADVYDVVVVNSRTTYQFTRRLYVRLIAQHDTSSHRLLLDSLASYELRPGTVFFAGYGALRERRTYRMASGRRTSSARCASRDAACSSKPRTSTGSSSSRAGLLPGRPLRSRRATPGWPRPSGWAPAGRSRAV